VTTTGTDSDFDVKLFDVYPNDYPNPGESHDSERLLDVSPAKMGGYKYLDYALERREKRSRISSRCASPS
jgi:hypothetical protein